MVREGGEKGDDLGRFAVQQVGALVAAKDWIEICKKEPEDKR
jgi:hypothetical protein